MHLLFATSIVPDGSLGSGYEIANEAILDGLRRAGARVTVIGYAWPSRKPSHPDETIVLGEQDVRTETASAPRKLAWLARAIAGNMTFSSAKMRMVDAASVRRQIERAGAFDAYVLNSVQFAGAFEPLFEDRPCLFVAHNAESVSATENARSARDMFQRFLFAREARLLAALEKRLCDKAQFVFTLTEEDRVALGVASPERSVVVPLTASLISPAPPRERAIEVDAALIGSWTWEPNRVGLDWFLRTVVPLLPNDFRIRIAGGMPSDISSSHPGVAFVGRVPDAKAFLRSAALVPLVSRGGTGVQLKTIETFELGLPSVATTSALRGIGHTPDNCVVADEPAAFAAAMLRLARAAPRDVDGRAFHRSQRTALDRAVERGLRKLGRIPAAVPA